MTVRLTAERIVLAVTIVLLALGVALEAHRADDAIAQVNSVEQQSNALFGSYRDTILRLEDTIGQLEASTPGSPPVPIPQVVIPVAPPYPRQPVPPEHVSRPTRPSTTPPSTSTTAPGPPVTAPPVTGPPTTGPCTVIPVPTPPSIPMLPRLPPVPPITVPCMRWPVRLLPSST